VRRRLKVQAELAALAEEHPAAAQQHDHSLDGRHGQVHTFYLKIPNYLKQKLK
jgi:hypothetical protein